MRPALFRSSSRGIAVVMLALVSSRVQAQTTANGRYYATPSWDQKLQCNTQATCPRFVVLANWDGNAVLDRETGLVWERSVANVHLTWAAAQFYCAQRFIGQRFAWRVPTIDELTSLIQPVEIDDPQSTKVPTSGPDIRSDSCRQRRHTGRAHLT